MPDIYTTATQLAILQGGRTPVWSTLAAADYADPPDTAISGVPLDGALKTLIHVSMRELAHTRTTRLTIPTVDLSATYTTTINATAVAYNAGSGGADADRQEVVDGIAAAINANGTVSPIVTATAVAASGSGARDTVIIRGDTDTDYSIAFAGGGSSVVAIVADPCTATLRPWWLLDARTGSTPPAQWVWSADSFSVTSRGYTGRFDSGGYARLHLELDTIAGFAGDGGTVTYRSPDVAIGPCLAEVE